MGATSAVAQSSLPLFLEAARDPGPASVALTARGLALGGLVAPSGAAEDAVLSPAGLLAGLGRRGILSLGAARMGRDELALTPSQMPPFDAARAAAPRTVGVPIGAALATSTGTWGAAAFVDAATTLAFRLATARNQLSAQAIPGLLLTADGVGTGSFSRRTVRLGGAFAGGTRNGALAVGVAVSADATSLNIASTLETTTTALFYAPYPPSRTDAVSVETTHVDVSRWRLGLALSVMARAGRGVTAGAYWHHRSPLQAVRDTATSGDPARTVRQDVTFDPPDQVGGSLSWGGVRSYAAVEVGWVQAAAVYRPVVLPSSPSSPCQTLRTPECPSWGFGAYTSVNGLIWRAGGEHRAGRLVFRAGLARETGYSLARAADDPAVNGGQAPAPAIPTPFTPPRHDRWTVAGGAGLVVGRAEVAGGISWAPGTVRALVDLRVVAR